MANESTYLKNTLTGKVSKRPSTFNGQGNDGNPFSKTSFNVTLPKATRTSERDGTDYEASDVYPLSIMANDSPETQELLAIVSDLDIGDRVTVEVAIRPGRQSSQAFLRVLSVRNDAQ